MERCHTRESCALVWPLYHKTSGPGFCRCSRIWQRPISLARRAFDKQRPALASQSVGKVIHGPASCSTSSQLRALADLREGRTGEAADARTEALNIVYKLYALNCFVERSWRFGLPLSLATVKGGFQTVAVVGFLSPLSVTVFGPACGRLLDLTPRRTALRFITCMQTGAIATAGLVLIHVLRLGPQLSLTRSPWFLFLLACSMLERLAAFASDIAIERDWITQLSGKSNQAALSHSNAMLRRLDLLSEMGGTFLFGCCLSCFGAPRTLAAVSAFSAATLPVMLALVDKVSLLAPRIMTRKRSLAAERDASLGELGPGQRNELSMRHVLTRLGLQAQQALGGWRQYAAQPILPASAAYVMLYFNTVLSPGGMMTAFLASRGLSGAASAVFRVGCALMGFTGTWPGSAIINGVGLLRAGVVAITFQAATLAGAALLYKAYLHRPVDAIAAADGAGGLLSGSVWGVPVPVLAFGALIMLSRVGMWSYDMVDAQLFQMAVAPKEAASVSSAEIALCSCAELVMLGVAAAFSDPASFSYLVALSCTAVLSAWAVYTAWVALFGAERRLRAALAPAAA